MDQPYFLKTLPAPLQALYRPMLLASLALHGLLLFIPTGFSERPTEPPKEKEPEKVQVTQLPTTSTTAAAPKPSVLTTPRPTPRTTPLVRQTPRLQPTPLTPLRQRSAIPPISQTRPLSRPQPQPAPAQTQAQQTAEPTQTQAQQTAEPTQTQATGDPTQAPSAPSQDPFANFPVYQPSQPGSLGIIPDPEADKAAFNTTDPLENVVAFYEQELPAKEFESQLSMPEETSLKIYSVSKGGVSRYLHLIANGEGTVILVANQPLDPNNLPDLGEDVPEAREFVAALKTIIDPDTASTLDASELNDPSLLQNPNVTNNLGATRGVTPQGLGGALEQNLRAQAFEVNLVSETFGGGYLYQAKKGRFVGYIGFVPTRDGQKTGVFTLSSDPTQ